MLKLKALLAKVLSRTVRVTSLNYSGTKTIASPGYLDLGASGVSGTIISVIISTWATNSGAVSVAIGSGNHIWLIGTAGATITNLTVRITYIP